jgi:hypothetical protein
VSQFRQSVEDALTGLEFMLLRRWFGWIGAAALRMPVAGRARWRIFAASAP